MLSGDQMRHFVSSQTYALRSFAATRNGPDRFGFAWAPNNATGMPNRAFVAETGALLDRLGASLADSGSEWMLDPGVQACLSLQLDWCRAEVPGAVFTGAWRIFSAWQLPRGTRGVPGALRTRVRIVARRAARA